MGNNYRIRLDEALAEYTINNDFQEVLQTGRFVYINELCILDAPQYVYRDEGGARRLTEYAIYNLEECALSFDPVTVYVIPENLHRGSGRNDDTVVTKTRKRFKNDLQEKELEKRLKLLQEAASSLKKDFDMQPVETCQDRIKEIILHHESTYRDFEDRTHLLSKYYYNALNQDKSKPELPHIVAIAAGYNLNLPETEELLGLAGHAFVPGIWEHRMYQFIIFFMQGLSIDAKNQILTQNGVAELGSKERF